MKVFTYIMMVGALCCLFCYSKEKEDAPTGATFNKTFVTGYLTPESIVISKMNSGIKITFKGDLITSGRSFDALSIYYNELSAPFKGAFCNGECTIAPQMQLGLY